MKLQLINLCKTLVDQNKVKNPIPFFTQHNRGDLIFRGDPNYCSKFPWYDWANVKWNVKETVPAKINIFMDLSNTFIDSFQVGTSCIEYPGYYAVSYTCESSAKTMSHPTSLLIEYNELIVNKEGNFKYLPELCMFNIDSIDSPCIAIPYLVKENIMNAISWNIIRPRDSWNDIFINYIKNGY